MAWDFTVLMISSNSLLEFLQAVLGWLLFVYVVSPLNFLTQAYTLYNLDDFRWGRMRKAATAKETQSRREGRD
jgi:chitin synthase